MAENYTLLDLAEEVLRQSDRPLSTLEIWKKADKLGLPDKLTKKNEGKTPWSTIGAKIYGDIKENGESSKWIKEGRGLFSLRKKMLEPPNSEAEKPKRRKTNEKKPSGNWKEKDLHPLLTHFAYNNLALGPKSFVVTKTVYHEESIRDGLGEWAHPDMVGAYWPTDNMDGKLIKLAQLSGSNLIKLYSFELKRVLNKGNYRPAFFQAVSNSSWAHEGYLVAAEIDSNDDFRSEIERLTLSFGIGIIHLDLDNFDNSSVLYPSRFKNHLDWGTMNKICSLNKNFKNFINSINVDFGAKERVSSKYDKVIDDPKKHIRGMMKI